MVHRTGHVLNDIKLDNIMIHKSEEKDVFRVLLIDYGMVTKYTDKDG
jgi:serine/threonine protein kinase